MITESEARGIASEWHGGQWSPLYSFASSGSLQRGADAIREAEQDLSDLARGIGEESEAPRLAALLEYLKAAFVKAESEARATIAARAGGLLFAGTDREQWPGHAFPGGYPLVYVCADGGMVCAKCLDTEPDFHFAGDRDEWMVIDVTMVEESEGGISCDSCNRTIVEATDA